MPSQQEMHRLLYKISQAYYNEGLTQQEIANRFRLSRPKISRLLQLAKDERIVNITLVPPAGGMEDEEYRLEQKFGLDEVSIVPVSDTSNQETVAREMGPYAVEVFLRSIQGNEVVSISWGNTILGMVNALPLENYKDMTLVQMIGGLGSNTSNEHSAELVRIAAQKLGAQFRLLTAPGIISNLTALKALKSDPHIAETLSLAAKADIAIVGMGILAQGSVLLQEGNILNKSDIKQIKESGAVGDVGLRFIKADGQPVELETNKRILGLSLEELQVIPRVIGIAGGDQKFDIILAALRAKFLNVLVTDQMTAKRLLEQGNRLQPGS